MALVICGNVLGPDVTVELVSILQKRIESALLRMLTNMLARNPSSKLDIADIQVPILIQNILTDCLFCHNPRFC